MCVPKWRTGQSGSGSESTHPAGAGSRTETRRSLCGVTAGAVQEGGDTSDGHSERWHETGGRPARQAPTPTPQSPPGPDVDHSERRSGGRSSPSGSWCSSGYILLGRPLVEGRLTAARNLDRATAIIADTNDGPRGDRRARACRSATSGSGSGPGTSAEIVGQPRGTAEGGGRALRDRIRAAHVRRAGASSDRQGDRSSHGSSVLDAAAAVLSAGTTGDREPEELRAGAQGVRSGGRQGATGGRRRLLKL